MEVSKPSAKEICCEFLHQYYSLLNESPQQMHRFYNHESSYIHDNLAIGSAATVLSFGHVACGQTAINKRIQDLSFKDARTLVLRMQAHETLNGGVVIQVIGMLSNNKEPLRPFLQTFVLACQNENSYYVYNDMFQYIDAVDGLFEPSEFDLSNNNNKTLQMSPQQPPQTSATSVVSAVLTDSVSIASAEFGSTQMPQTPPHTALADTQAADAHVLSASTHHSCVAPSGGAVTDAGDTCALSTHVVGSRGQPQADVGVSIAASLVAAIHADNVQVDQSIAAAITTVSAACIAGPVPGRITQPAVAQHVSAVTTQELAATVAGSTQAETAVVSNTGTVLTNGHVTSHGVVAASEVGEKPLDQSPQSTETGTAQGATQVAEPSLDGATGSVDDEAPVTGHDLTACCVHQPVTQTGSVVDTFVSPVVSETRTFANLLKSVPASSNTGGTTVGHVPAMGANPVAGGAWRAKKERYETGTNHSSNYHGSHGNYYHGNQNYQQNRGNHVSRDSTNTSGPLDESYVTNERKNYYPQHQNMSFPDSHQIFVGNLPQDVLTDELVEHFKSFGKVLDVKVNPNKNVQRNHMGHPANNSGPLPGPRMCPYYGFVVFENSAVVDEIMAKMPGTLMRNGQAHRLNIERKQQRSSADFRGGNYGGGGSRGGVQTGGGGGGRGSYPRGGGATGMGVGRSGPMYSGHRGGRGGAGNMGRR